MRLRRLKIPKQSEFSQAKVYKKIWTQKFHQEVFDKIFLTSKFLLEMDPHSLIYKK